MAKPGSDDSSRGNLGVSTYCVGEREVKMLKTISQSEALDVDFQFYCSLFLLCRGLEGGGGAWSKETIYNLFTLRRHLL